MLILKNLERFLFRAKRVIKCYTTSEDTMMDKLLFPAFKQNSRMGFGTHQNTPITTVSEGTLKGTVNELLDGSSYYSFKGIPYAQPPLGDLRFKAPVPKTPWEGILNASEHGSNCPQFDMATGLILEGNEDCLYLNVYTKTLKENSKMPVMVYIHGGGYSSGSGDSDTYGPEFLLCHDVVLVTINYRLEVLGFLALDIPEVPGNAGMKDQVLALKWVKTNIAKFGGDPDNVTLFGESAGSSSATFHMLSPMSRGMFTKIIGQSGVCLSDWAFGKGIIERAFRLGRHLGKDTNDVNELLEFLKGVPAVKLAKMNIKTRTDDEKFRGLPLHFGPVVEKNFDGVDAFLKEDPVSMVLSNKIARVPIILGYTSSDGMPMLEDMRKKSSFLTKHPSYLVPFEIVQKVSQERLMEFGQRIKRFYFGDKDMSNDTADAIVDLATDLHFSYNTYRFLQFYSGTNQPIYMYKFDLVTELNAMKMVLGLSDMKGAAHADDIFYLFCNNFNKDAYLKSEEIRQIIYRLTKLWTDFARTGNPTPDDSAGFKWPHFTRSGKEYLNMSKSFTTGQYCEKERVEFWNKLYSEAGLPCMHRSSL